MGAQGPVAHEPPKRTPTSGTARLSAEGPSPWLTPTAGPARSTHLIAGPVLVLQGGDEQAGGARAAPLAPSLRPRLTFGRLLTEDQHRSDALASVPQAQGRQVPTDHLHLTVQLHVAEAAATRSTNQL